MVRYAVDLPVDVIESNVASAFDLVVQTARSLDGSRFVSEVAEFSFNRERRSCDVETLFKRDVSERYGTWLAAPCWLEELPRTGTAVREEVEAWRRMSCLAA